MSGIEHFNADLTQRADSTAVLEPRGGRTGTKKLDARTETPAWRGAELLASLLGTEPIFIFNCRVMSDLWQTIDMGEIVDRPAAPYENGFVSVWGADEWDQVDKFLTNFRCGGNNTRNYILNDFKLFYVSNPSIQ